MVFMRQMTILFLVMIVGYIARRRGIIDAHASKKLSSIILYIANPCMVMAGVLGPTSITRGQVLTTMGISWIVYAVLVVTSFAVPVLLGLHKAPQGKLYQLMYIFSNIGFMGFPVMSAVLGQESVLYGTLFVLPYNTLVYTYGIWLLKKARRMEAEREGRALPEEKEAGLKGTLSRILNIGVVSCVAAVVWFLLGIPLPNVLYRTFDMLGDLTGPLCMLVIGTSFYGMDLKKLVTDVRLLLFSLGKQILTPVIGIYLLRLFGVTDRMLLGVCMVILAMPVGALCSMMAQEYDGDVDLTSRGVALTSVMTVATLPLVSMICGI